MSEAQTNDQKVPCCWVRLVKVGTAAREAEEKRKMAPSASGPEARHENRPPPRVSSVQNRQGRQLKGAWFAPEECLGRDLVDTVFEYGPAFESVAEATKWLANSDDGQLWDRDALNRMLICYDAKQTADELDKPKPCEPGKKPKDFPEDCWDPELRKRWPDIGDRPINFLGSPVTLPGWNDGCEQMQQAGEDAPPGAIAMDDLHREAHGAAHVTARMLQVVGLNLDGPPFNIAGKKARTQLLDLVTPVIYLLKSRHKRARPFMSCDNVKPIYRDDDWRTPRHLAYPSGHAVVAGLWQTLLAHRFPLRRASLELAARGIAQRRVEAGLHYPSDIDHGLQLGHELGDIVLKNLGDHKLRAFKDWFETLG